MIGKTSHRALREAAQKLAPLALETLRDLMQGSGSDASRLAAAREVLDRAHGKARANTSDGQDDDGMVVKIRRFGDGPTTSAA